MSVTDGPMLEPRRRCAPDRTLAELALATPASVPSGVHTPWVDRQKKTVRPPNTIGLTSRRRAARGMVGSDPPRFLDETGITNNLLRASAAPRAERVDHTPGGRSD